MIDFTFTSYRYLQGDVHRAIFVTWHEVTRVLGHKHTGHQTDDNTLIQAIVDSDEVSASWVEDTHGATDEDGWYLVQDEPTELHHEV